MATKVKQRRKKTPKSGWRASWKGELQVGLVRFSVEAINAHSPSGSDVHFHQLHAECHSRIKYQKVCPVHGEVSQDEIVLGYEYARGKYVEIDPDELDRLRTKEERALKIEEFIEPSQLDSIYYDGRMYYLAPSEANDREPYHLLCRALEDSDRIGIGQVVFSGKEQLAVIRPRDGGLMMAMLNYAPEVRDESTLQKGTADLRVSAANLRLARELIGSMDAKHFSIDDYEDRYRKRVKELIAARRKGREVEEPEEEDEPEVINRMDALKKSLSRPSSRSGHAAATHKRKRKAR